MPTVAHRNPQTVAFLEMLGLPYNLDHGATAGPAAEPDSASAFAAARDPDEIDIDALDELEESLTVALKAGGDSATVNDPDEIHIDEGLEGDNNNDDGMFRPIGSLC